MDLSILTSPLGEFIKIFKLIVLIIFLNNLCAYDPVQRIMHQLSQSFQEINCQGSDCYLYKLNFNKIFKDYIANRFIGANLSDAIIEECYLKDIDFQGANLSGAKIINSTLININFDFADLTDTLFKDCTFTNVKTINSIKNNTLFIKINCENKIDDNFDQQYGPFLPPPQIADEVCASPSAQHNAHEAESVQPPEAESEQPYDHEAGLAQPDDPEAELDNDSQQICFSESDDEENLELDSSEIANLKEYLDLIKP
jgi:uncharacterized protein YjbI with pentapeptide repeats